jgi:hypothetical protein
MTFTAATVGSAPDSPVAAERLDGRFDFVALVKRGNGIDTYTGVLSRGVGGDAPRSEGPGHTGRRREQVGRTTVGLVLAFIAGYVIGARDGSDALDEVIDAARAVAASQEFDDLVRALRSHAGHVLQEVGRRIDPSSGEEMSMSTILGRARDIVQRSATESEF